MTLLTATGRLDRLEIVQRAKEIYVAGDSWSVAMRKAYSEALAQRTLSEAAEQRETARRIAQARWSR